MREMEVYYDCLTDKFAGKVVVPLALFGNQAAHISSPVASNTLGRQLVSHKP